MPELPEVETTKQGIAPFIMGQIIERVVVRQGKLRWEVPEHLKNLTHTKVVNLTRRAKYLLIHTECGDIVGHLGMSGSLKMVESDTPIEKHDHLDFILNNGKILRYHDPRRFGAWLWAEKGETLPILQKLGVEPLSDEFNADYLFRHTRNKKMPIKNALMHNPLVVGIGNIYANESLFLCGIHPALPAQKLSFAQCERLTATIKNVLEKAILQGGTTLKDFKQPDGKLGYFAQQLFIYGKKGKPCPHCFATIESIIIGQRNSFFCPQCQILPK